MHARGSSQLNQSMQALSACVDDCPQATPRPSHYQAFFAVSRRRKRPREEDEALSIILKESRPFSTITLSLSWRNMALHTDAAGRLRLSVPLNTSRAARRMLAGPFLQATVQPPPRLNCILLVLPCPEVIVLGAGTDGASWEKRLPQVPPSPGAVSRLEENAPLRKAHDSTVTILVRQEFSCEV